MRLKIHGLFLFLFLCGSSMGIAKDANLSKDLLKDSKDINKMVAVIYGVDGVEVITKSDCERGTLGQGQMTPKDVVIERLMYQDSKKLKIEIDDDAVNQYLARIQEQHGISAEDLEGIFRQAGHTIEGGREHFRRVQAIQALLDYKIKSKIIVPKEEVEKYYKENPVEEKKFCIVQRGVTAISGKKSIGEQKEIIEKTIKQKKLLKDVKWGDPFRIEVDTVAESMLFLFDEKEGFISSPQEIDGSFELFRIKKKQEKRTKPLDERYSEILDRLRVPLYKKLLAEYESELLKNASISILDKSFFEEAFLKSVSV